MIFFNEAASFVGDPKGRHRSDKVKLPRLGRLVGYGFAKIAARFDGGRVFAVWGGERWFAGVHGHRWYEPEGMKEQLRRIE